MSLIWFRTLILWRVCRQCVKEYNFKSNLLNHYGEITIHLLVSDSMPHSDSCCFSYCVTGREAESWCGAGGSWCGVNILGAVSEQPDACSAKPVLKVSPGNCPNVNHQESTYQGAFALKADRKQRHSKDAATLCLWQELAGEACCVLWHRLFLIQFHYIHSKAAIWGKYVSCNGQ